MLYQQFGFILTVLAYNAATQEYVVCLTPDNIINTSNLQILSTRTQTFRGGQGPKGQKGDPCTRDNSQENSLRGEI